jgi:hypothetical protein
MTNRAVDTSLVVGTVHGYEGSIDGDGYSGVVFGHMPAKLLLAGGCRKADGANEFTGWG